ncbi:hypothetical protein LTR62_007803 [Meristemomyces frigidus]|uniref:Oxidase ustYa n=1 Tax=Meristemomyces frigidus TaxID=1508187 RepID=A0AAN7TAN3_9PEZI|nr:hypothetical protein LTR62_007803 [Meristemomyces frigidus]
MVDSTVYHKLEREGDASSEHDDRDDEIHSDTLLPRSRKHSLWPAWIRIFCEVVLVATVVLLGLKVASSSRKEGHPGPNDPRKHLGYVDTVFMNDTRFANEAALANSTALRETLEQWVTLSSKGRGYVRIPEDEREGMDGPPYLLNPLHRPVQSEAYMVSGLHQLHCLSTIMASYSRMRQGEDESEMGYHIAHCFDYLRQGILCAGDATLEGNQSATYPGVEIPWGTAHRCTNWQALVDWADERTIWPFPPGIDIL